VDGGTRSPDSKRACTADNTEFTLLLLAEQLHALYELCHRGQKKELHSCPFLLLVLTFHSGFDEKCENAAGGIWLAFTRAISISEGESPALCRVMNSGYTGFHALLRLQPLRLARLRSLTHQTSPPSRCSWPKSENWTRARAKRENSMSGRHTTGSGITPVIHQSGYVGELRRLRP
jgi:hypothetical protein